VILESKPDGILLGPSFIDESVTFTDKCQELNIPYVLIDSDLPNKSSLSYIGPNLYHSGYMGGHLISYLTGEDDKLLIVNISKEIDNEHHLLKKEEGLRTYFKDHNRAGNIVKLDIKDVADKAIEESLSKVFDEPDDIKVVFVTNSRVSKVARFIEKSKHDVILIGYDFLAENVEYMKKGVIDFLICQKPKQQAYRGVMSLYQHLAFGSAVEKIHFMPIDILTKENADFYRN
jgi:LacI family transcriptional regulator